ncbi:MAG: HEAT repeat domain-containing protein [Spirochaetaceae bacterium]|nr:HEAT repeat domain-containing protein [Spirochaetaceae bacterium]
MRRKMTLALALAVLLLPRPASEEAVQLWRGALPGVGASPPVVEAETITLICESGILSCYSISGALLWNFSAGSRLTRFISRSPEGMVYICRMNGVFIALNRVGREIWRVDLGAPLATPAIVGRDGRLLLFTTARILCVTASGTVLWRRNLESSPAFPPRITGSGYFLAGLENGELLEVSPFGRIQTRRYTDTLVDVLSLRDGSLIVFTVGGKANMAPGFGFEGPAYIFPPLERPPAAAMARGQNAALILTNGKVALLSGGDGAEGTGPGVRWVRESGIPGPVTGDDTAVVYDDRGITALTKTVVRSFSVDGEETRSFRLPRPASAPPALNEAGVVYASGADWILYAWQFTEPSREAARDRARYHDAYGTADPRLDSPEKYEFGFSGTEIRIALQDIRRNVDSGAIGNAEWLYLGYLMEIASNLGRDTLPSRARREIEPYDPILLTHRRAALEILGRLGSRETLPFLISLYERDPDPVVKSAAAEAIGKIGLDPSGGALRAFAALIYGPVYYRDEQVLLATAAATGALCRFSGPPLSEAGIRLLSALEMADRPQTVRRAAKRELDTLRNYE